MATSFCPPSIIFSTSRNSSLLPQAPACPRNLFPEGLKHNGLVLIAFHQTTQTQCVMDTQPTHVMNASTHMACEELIAYCPSVVFIYICMYAFWFPSIGWRRTVAAIIHSCTCFLTCSSNSGGWEASTRWVRSVGRRVLWLSTPPMYNPHLQRKSEHSGSYIVEEKAPNAEETFCSNKVFSLIAVDMRVWVCTSGVATRSASTLCIL